MLPQLYGASETYYKLADATVDAAEDYVDTIVLKIKTLEVWIWWSLSLGFIYATKLKDMRDLHKEKIRR